MDIYVGNRKKERFQEKKEKEKALMRFYKIGSLGPYDISWGYSQDKGRIDDYFSKRVNFFWTTCVGTVGFVWNLCN